MEKRARLNSDRTGGTSAVSTASENPPVVISSCESKKNSSERTGGTSAAAACGNPPVISSGPDTEFLTDEDVCAALARHGFADAGTDAARLLFKRVSYQHLSPYIHAAESMGGAPSLKRAHDLLTLDRRFQAAMFKYVGIFETQFRAAYLSAMAGAHGAFALYDESLFLRPELYGRTRAIHDAEIAHKARRSRSVESSLNLHGGMLPIWKSIEFMSLGTLSKFFSNTGDRAVTNGVVASFGVSKPQMSSWLRTITEARNIFAHFGFYVVRRQIPGAPLKLRGVSIPNTSSLYLAVLLHRLLDAPEPMSDPNMRYAARLQQDAVASIGWFFDIYGDECPVPGIPRDWRAALSFWDM